MNITLSALEISNRLKPIIEKEFGIVVKMEDVKKQLHGI